MSVIRPESAVIPDAPGAYLFRDSDGRAVYVGKALSLRKRLASYWGRPLHPRTEAMMEQASAVEWIVATTEVDALMLEYNLIKSHRPRFNVRYRDDKSYPYLALTVGEKWPRARVMRGPRRKDVRYFGPYGHAYAIRETLDALTRVFPVRTCSNAFFDQRARAGRPCLYYDIGRCAGPCVPSMTGVTEESYRQHVEAMSDFLVGNHRPVLTRLQAEMRQAAEALEFERAAKLRDQLAAARKAMESQEMVLGRSDDIDVIGMEEDDLEAAFQVFFVRRGRVMGRRGGVVDKVEDIDTAGLVGRFVGGVVKGRGRVTATGLRPASPPARGGPWGGGVAEGRVAPPLGDQGRPGPGRFRKYGRGAAPPVRPPAERGTREPGGAASGHLHRDQAGQALRVSAGAHRRGRGTGTALRGRAGVGRLRAPDPRHRPGEAAGGGLSARPARAPCHRAGVGGVVRPPA